MSETPAKVRLVRCPKCENLLPEVAGYSVYQCGGCDAVLRAKNNGVESDTFSEKSDEEIVGGVLDKISKKSGDFDFLEGRVMDLSDGSENDVKFTGSSSSKAGDYKNGLIVKADRLVVEDDPEMDKNIEELGSLKLEQELEDLNPQIGDRNGSQRSVRTLKWKSAEKGEMEGLQSTQKVDVEGLKNLNLKYSEEGPSYHSGSGQNYAEPVKNRNDPGTEYIEDDRAELLRKLDELKDHDDRAELLRKLDELKDQISRSRHVVEKSKEKVPLDRRVDPYSGAEKWSSDGSLVSNRVSMQYSIPDNLARPPYYNYYTEPSPFVNMNEIAMQSRYPSLHTSNQVQGFSDPFGSQMLRRAPQQAPSPFDQNPYHPYFSGQYINNDATGLNLLEHYPHNRNLHHESCSCLLCYNKHQQFPPPIVPNHPMFYHHENPNGFAPRDYDPRFSNHPPMNFHNPKPHTRWPSDLSSEKGGFVRLLVATGGHRCHPIAGGAPFVACCNCFELLQIPKKVSSIGKTQNKMRCAACSEVIGFSVLHKKLVLSVYSEAKGNSEKIDDRSNVVLNQGSSHKQGHEKWDSTEFSSDKYDNLGYDFQSMDRILVSPLTGPSSSSNKSAAMRSLHSTSSFTSEDEITPASTIATREEAKLAELEKSKPSPPPSGSPLQDHFDYSSKYNRVRKGSRSGRSEIEKVMPKRANSVKDVAVATEMEISSNEYSINTGTSQDSGEASREDDQLRINRGGESFFAGIIKKSFRELSRSSQHAEQGKINVVVNGQDIPDRLVKKAEKLAGPIQPGEYWYDSRAGFWGVIGGPCRGIIPPFIEEFNYPMPENCAGGNIGVFVNGRELYQKDLDLLGSRGLPTERDRSYIIEISGRVLDEDSGEELDSLGKLAPTVEKAKHGFGMKVPRVVA